MTRKTKKALDTAAREWVMASAIIANAAEEMSQGWLTRQQCEQAAAAIIARLAANDPPLVICTMDQVKERS